MKIYGLDFTSAPTRKKTIVCAECCLGREVLTVERFIKFPGFQGFEESLRSAGPWVAGMDFPFGQPRRLVENLGWPLRWEDYVLHVASMGKQRFESAIRKYVQGRENGDKHHKRHVDCLSNSRSPMMLDYTPVGKMFFQGATRIAQAEVSVLPCRPRDTDRLVVEAYPALVARKAIGSASYKTGRSADNAAKRSARRRIIEWLGTDHFRSNYGMEMTWSSSKSAACVDDESGDSLDAVLCAIQSAWAYSLRDIGFGIPSSCDSLEGWIVDPSICVFRSKARLDSGGKRGVIPG